MKFSVCIPNYNYERYLGRTIQSVLNQTDGDWELLICDNASTDRSLEVVAGFADPRIKSRRNPCNVGFAGNLDRAGGMAVGERMIMLSSDDLMRPDALATYRAVCDALGPDSAGCAISATWDVIDPDDCVTDRTGPDAAVWLPGDRRPDLDAVAGGPVYVVAADELLRRSVLNMKNPFNFAATCYSRATYEAVGGYGGGRMINPDKWFHWKLLTKATRACFIDRALFAYRWHPTNQTAVQAATGALKYPVDEYVSTLELDAAVLSRLGLTRDQVVAAFIEHDIVNHALATLARGERLRARRIHDFGRAVYPDAMKRNRRGRLLRALLALGPIGQRIAARAYAARQRKQLAEAAESD